MLPHFSARLSTLPVVALLFILAGCVPPQATPEAGRYLVYFDEFSANLQPDALNVIATAAQKARETGAQAVRIEARASATGSFEANKKLAETRAQVVADTLQKDGVPPPMILQLPIGQTGSDDTGVYNRRVDIVLLPH
jgi:outer membrane protein OmpA-like peptidoglycan-associated protein